MSNGKQDIRRTKGMPADPEYQGLTKPEDLRHGTTKKLHSFYEGQANAQLDKMKGFFSDQDILWTFLDVAEREGNVKESTLAKKYFRMLKDVEDNKHGLLRRVQKADADLKKGIPMQMEDFPKNMITEKDQKEWAKLSNKI